MNEPIVATIGEYKDFIKTVRNHISVPDENGEFWMDVYPDLTYEDIELAQIMGIKFRHNTTTRKGRLHR